MHTAQGKTQRDAYEKADTEGFDMSERHYVLEVSLKEVTHVAPTIPYRGAGDRTPPPKGDREVNERLKFIATTDTLKEALERVSDWATSELKYVPGGEKNPSEIVVRGWTS